jgi:hypothetical protein
VRDRSPSRVRLRVEELLVRGEGEEGENVDVILDRSEEEGEEVRCGRGVVEVGRVGVCGALIRGKGQDLIDVGKLGGVARDGEVRERDEEGGDVLYGQVGARL